MRILVTGGTGFIGSRLVRSLVERGQDEIFFTGRRDLATHDPRRVGAHFLQGDLNDSHFVEDITRAKDIIVHCAGLASAWGSWQSFYRANVMTTQLLLEKARAQGVQRFINLSSPSLYFSYRHQINLNENDIPQKFSNAYARSKYEAEQLVQSYHAEEFLTVSLRPRAVIGAGDENIMPRLLRLREKGTLFQIGDGGNVIDVTTVGNLSDAIFLCLSAPKAAMGGSYNITNGEPILFWDFVDQVLNQAGLALKKRHLPYLPVMTAAVLVELYSRLSGQKEEPALLPISVGITTFSMTLDITRAREKLGYSPKHSTQDGIREFFA
jgi:nucleoside-diphosphate-sugar epimerase